jgi:hypothetical protein
LHIVKWFEDIEDAGAANKEITITIETAKIK